VTPGTAGAAGCAAGWEGRALRRRVTVTHQARNGHGVMARPSPPPAAASHLERQLGSARPSLGGLAGVQAQRAEVGGGGAAAAHVRGVEGVLSRRGGGQHRWHSLADCDHGASSSSRFRLTARATSSRRSERVRGEGAEEGSRPAVALPRAALARPAGCSRGGAAGVCSAAAGGAGSTVPSSGAAPLPPPPPPPRGVS
jgi:hypothetical protein